MLWIPAAFAQNFMPPAASKVAEQVDSLYAFLLTASLISFIILIGGMIYFVNKYRRRSDNDKTAYITHDYRLEFLWSFIPFVIFMVSFAWGAIIYYDMRNIPADEEALEIHVLAKKWLWQFTYKNGRVEAGGVDDQGLPVPATLTVPVGKTVKLIMTSVKVDPENKKDRAVLHSFWVPALRVKQDVVPGRYTQLLFKAEKQGMFQVFCTEYCGTGHSTMLARVHVVSPQQFDDFIVGEAGASGEVSLADLGKKIYTTRACMGCHSLDGKKMTGPSWQGLFGSTRKFADGSSAVADENYIRESIMEPNKRISSGFEPNQMPSYNGQLTDEDLNAVIEFMKKFK